MSIESAHREIVSHQQQVARLQQEKSREAGRAADASKKAAGATEAATRTTNATTRASRVRDAQRYHADAATHQQRVANIESKISAEQKRIGDAQKNLATEHERAQKKLVEAQKKSAAEQERAQKRLGDAQKKSATEQERAQKRLVEAQKKSSSEQKRAQRKLLQEQEDAAREQGRRMMELSGKLAQHSRLHAETNAAMDRLQLLPERIQVLFLASNPRDQQQLLLDEEVRSVSDMIRKSLHRDAVCLESRWALRPLDLLQALNEVKPRIVHFCGHGSDQDEIIFQDDLGASKPVSKEAIVQTMAATAGDIQLVFFNTCYSRAQAEAVTGYVPAAIGMNTTIGDKAARVFSSQFYSAIGFGLSIAKAFAQAKASLMLEGIAEENTPELFLADGVDGDDLVLVRPSTSA